MRALRPFSLQIHSMPVSGLKQVRFADDLATVMGREYSSCAASVEQGLVDVNMMVRSQAAVFAPVHAALDHRIFQTFL